MQKKVTINIITHIDLINWTPLVRLFNNKVNFIISKIPINADYHVVYHLKRKLIIPNCKSRIAFIVTEPPEIEKLNIKFLEQFGAVFSPNFTYLKPLKNLVVTGGLILWQAGFTYRPSQVVESNPFDTIVSSWNIDRPILLSVITSNKLITPLHRKRIKFINEVRLKIPRVEIFGRGYNEINDKSEILLKSKYHLALENSIHDGYWTEKFIDPLICGTQIFYSGDESLGNVFKSFIPIDLDDFDGAIRTINQAISSDIWAKNSNVRQNDFLNYLNKSNLFSVLVDWVDNNNSAGKTNRTKIRAERSKYLIFLRRVLGFTKIRDFKLFFQYFTKKNNAKPRRF